METGESVICPLCQTANKGFEAFCRHCGAPIGATATFDPLNVIRAETQLYREALEGQPKLIVLIGVWILFFPILLICLPGAVFLIVEHSSAVGFMAFWFGVILSAVSIVMLYRVTKNYFRPAALKKKLRS